MRKKALRLFILALFSLCPGFMQAQIALVPSVISSSGGYFTSENYALSWTLGEIAVITLYGDHMIFSQGFQQGTYKKVGLGVNEIELNISAYPNPLKNELRIQFSLLRPEDIRIEILDVTGRVVLQEFHKDLLNNDLVILNVSEFIPGIYFLKILSKESQQLYVSSLTKL